MRDFARSENAAVQAQLDRLAQLNVPDGRLGLDTIRALLDRLGNPHRKLPPVFHVAGTNGKGSTCAFLRAMLEAEGYKVHMTTSPHLVRYNERIRVAGELISDERLAELLAEVLDVGEDLNPSFFEVTIAAAFTEFARVPADACVVEVGLGGRFDATNVLEPDVLAACGIAALGIDHERFLLAPEDGVPQEPIARIAFEKAGIAKRGVPLVTMGNEYPPEARDVIRRVAASIGAPLLERTDNAIDDLMTFNIDGEGFTSDQGDQVRNLAQLGPHQRRNAWLAKEMLRSQDILPVAEKSFIRGLRVAHWPARLQLLRPGPLTALVGEDRLWLDGGHNLSAGKAIAKYFNEPLHLVLGMLEAKDPQALIGPLGDYVQTLTVVPVPHHDDHPTEAFGPDARAAGNVEEALLMLPDDGLPILIAGSLYLAGEVLRLNDELPD
ncbi:bifunctional folylpolyglutamate synthase/dihydrofolate synthase [Qipengyuania gelatinilytica]|uniref:Bifunctional folylpolyglutamate synthase/dihydrofolate synthase n=1 Tax=Qipengyuania gelatinilytica TaxID=2867231 RepID=A0ABX9A391_9SPHN|nr:folylpolyglutamate synthase/dihydrofolate synthase family protein [Qipengyuania gelatinilytica]QZD95532.1 bifunctional folylpolyglutamate synthase/dihydrofolate synthase [Qipengyuania gelatinilytica]